MRCFVGWDVGAWNADRPGKSQDALCVLAEDGNNLRVAGALWRGNLREVLSENDGLSLARSILDLCDVRAECLDQAIFAIDAPLGWPSAALRLFVDDQTEPVPSKAAQNPYVFRRTEVLLAERGFRPLSAVRDMIGSQSTKGIHFLRRMNMQATRTGVWETSYGTLSVTGIETYPAPSKHSARLNERFDEIRWLPPFIDELEDGSARIKDMKDALYARWWDGCM